MAGTEMTKCDDGTYIAGRRSLAAEGGRSWRVYSGRSCELAARLLTQYANCISYCVFLALYGFGIRARPRARPPPCTLSNGIDGVHSCHCNRGCCARATVIGRFDPTRLQLQPRFRRRLLADGAATAWDRPLPSRIALRRHRTHHRS